MEHTEKCLAEQGRVKAAFEAYVTRWPFYCWSCNATGFNSWTEDGAPHGAGFWAMPTSEPCSECSEVGKCPRCGQPGLTSEERGDSDTGSGPCWVCGWNDDDACPPETLDGPCACMEAEWATWKEEPYLENYDYRGDHRAI